MGRCPYCQSIIEELKAYSRMEAKQLTFLLHKERWMDEDLDYDASEDIPESSTWVDYQCPECEHILFRDYELPKLDVRQMVIDFLAGRSSKVMKIPTDEDLSRIAREMLEHKFGETLYHLSHVWIYGDLEMRESLRTCYEETLVRLGKLKVVEE
jgi:hypothetical protein